MNSDAVLRFLLNQPFEPFTMFLVDGRTMTIRHPEVVNIGRYALSMRVMDDEGRVELVDVGLVVSMRTVDPSETAFMEVGPNDTDQG